MTEPNPDRPQLDVATFRRLGYLQEANRQFFHPLGLALTVRVNEDGTEAFGPIWDGRDDPEGWNFADNGIDPEKVQHVGTEQAVRFGARRAGLGYVIQPPPPASPPPPATPPRVAAARHTPDPDQPQDPR